MKKALVVGIDNYPFSPLYACINDAHAVASLIEKNDDGSANFAVQYYKDISNKSLLKERLHELFRGEPEIALFYFAGHGFENDVDAYLLAGDTKAMDEGVSMTELLVMANKSGAKNKVIILDCCYSGNAGSPKISGGALSQITNGVTILTACRENETSREINGHGVFTNLLLDALAGTAADISGNITPGSIYAYIDKALGAWDQRPVFKTNISQFVCLRKVAPALSADSLRRIITYFPNGNEKFPLNPSYEQTNTGKYRHRKIEPFAVSENVVMFRELQLLQSVGLVKPVDAAHMYYAAMESKSCELTPLGRHYWKLIKQKVL